MNKNFLSVLLVLLPFLIQAQSSQVKPQVTQTAVGLNLGHAPDNAFHDENFSHGGYIRASLSLLRSSGSIQYGLTIEGGTNSNDFWYLSPGLFANYIFPSGNAYFYAGAMAGYICSDDMMEDLTKSGMAHGYAFGIQGGFVQPLGRRLSLTTEVAARSTQLWQKMRTPHFLTAIDRGEVITRQNTVIYFPVSLGLRYNF